MPAEQTYKNHARTDPPMHFFVFPVVLINVGVAIYLAIHLRHQHPLLGLWIVIVSLALAVLATKCRVNDLKLQDRIIRLEERLRLAALLPSTEAAHIPELEVRQLIALRFASDAELSELAHRTLTQRLEPRAIKQAITHWRPDNHRV